MRVIPLASLVFAAWGCAPVSLPGVSSSAHETADAAPACPPDPSATPASFVRPPVRAGRCSTQQLSEFRAHCFAPATADQAACATWGQNNPDCQACALSTNSASTWGPLVAFQLPGEVDFANVGGCIAALDPSSETCAETVQAQLQCLLAACGSCPVSAAAELDARRETLDELNACFDAANAGPCAMTQTAASTCIAAASSGPAAACATMNDDLDSLFSVMTTMCGAP